MSNPDALRFSELLAFYLNGTLNEQDRHFVEQYLREHPEADAELQFAGLLQTRLTAITPSTSASSKGLDRLLADLAELNRGDASTGSGHWTKLVERLTRWRGEWGLTPAFATVAAVAVVQTALLVHQASAPSPPDNWSETRGQTAVAETGLLLRLSIKPDARFADLVEVIRTAQGRIVSGPDEEARLTVQFPDETDPVEVESLLRNSGLVDDVSAIPVR